MNHLDEKRDFITPYRTRKGKLEGKLERNIEIARAMLLKRYPIDDIMLLTGLSRSPIQDLVEAVFG